MQQPLGPWVARIAIDAMAVHGVAWLRVTYYLDEAVGATRDVLYLDLSECPLTLYRLESSAAFTPSQSGSCMVLHRHPDHEWRGATISFELALGELRALEEGRMSPVIVPDDLPRLVAGEAQRSPLARIEWAPDELLGAVRFLSRPLVRNGITAITDSVWGVICLRVDPEADDGLVLYSPKTARHRLVETPLVEAIAQSTAMLTEIMGDPPLPWCLVVEEEELRRSYPWTGAVLPISRTGVGQIELSAGPDLVIAITQSLAGAWAGTLWRCAERNTDWVLWGLHSGAVLHLASLLAPPRHLELAAHYQRYTRPGLWRRFTREGIEDRLVGLMSLRVEEWLGTADGRADFRARMWEVRGDTLPGRDVLVDLGMRDLADLWERHRHH